MFLVPQYVHEGKSYLTIAIGCTGGRHRSVMVAEALQAGAAQGAGRARPGAPSRRESAGMSDEHSRIPSAAAWPVHVCRSASSSSRTASWRRTGQRGRGHRGRHGEHQPVSIGWHDDVELARQEIGRRSRARRDGARARWC